MNVDLAAVAVAQTGDTQLFSMDVSKSEYAGFEVKNLHATVALDNVDIYFKFSHVGTEIKVANVAGDFTTPNYPIVKASGDLNVLAGASSGWVVVDVRGVTEMIVKASAANTGVTVDVHAGC